MLEVYSRVLKDICAQTLPASRPYGKHDLDEASALGAYRTGRHLLEWAVERRSCAHDERLVVFGEAVLSIQRLHEGWLLFGQREFPEALESREPDVGLLLERGVGNWSKATDILLKISGHIKHPCCAIREEEEDEPFNPAMHEGIQDLNLPPVEHDSDEELEAPKSRLAQYWPLCNKGAYRLKQTTVKLDDGFEFKIPPMAPVVGWNDNYDEYDSGPFRIQGPVPIGRLRLPYAMPAFEPTLNLLAKFKDRGHRKSPSFFQLFNKEEPLHVSRHFLPGKRFPLPTPTNRSTAVERLGVAEVLERWEASKATYPDAHIGIFLMGRLPPGEGEGTEADLDMRQWPKYVLRMDETHMPEVEGEDMRIDADIDSVIWVTDRPCFKSSVQLRIASHFMGEGSPGIRKNNRVSIELLGPRLKEEEPYRNAETYPLHTIPHIHFLTSSLAATPFYTYIFFPRIIVRSKGTRSRYFNFIPLPLQKRFFSEVVIPALNAVSDSMAQNYTKFDLENLNWKAGAGKQAGTVKNFALPAEVVPALERKMRDIISGRADLDQFGSFFFVTDARGIKLSTKVHLSQPVMRGALLGKLKALPGLDWEYMFDRCNGELLLDVGVTFTPQCEEMVVGLWNLDGLLYSYSAAGFNAPVQHPSLTLDGYGNLQAEMGRDRRRASHVLFRQSYTLNFEAVRNTKKDLPLTSDENAYQGGNDYRNAVGPLLKVCQSLQKGSSALREEVRMGGQAFLMIEHRIGRLVSAGSFGQRAALNVSDQLIDRL